MLKYINYHYHVDVGEIIHSNTWMQYFLSHLAYSDQVKWLLSANRQYLILL